MTNRYEDNINSQLDAKRAKRILSKTSESTIHTHIATYLWHALKKGVVWNTVEVSNQQGGKSAMIRQAKLRKKGVRKGWPDIQLFWPHPVHSNCTQGLCLEVKRPGGVVSDAQKACHADLARVNIPTAIVYSVEEAREAIRVYKVPTMEAMEW